MQLISKIKYKTIAWNDCNYPISKTIDGKRVWCPYYLVWRRMIDRVYAKSYHKTRPTYKQCDLCSDWHTFSNFKRWMMRQDWVDKQLDKDLIAPNNKTYSPETCVFVTHKLNNLLVEHKNASKCLPKGVYKESTNSYRARIKIDNKDVGLGSYRKPSEARKAYVEAKRKVILEEADKISDERLKNGLLLHASMLE